MGCGSGMSCWRRLHDWQEAGIWQLLHFVLLDWLARYGQIDWSRAVVDGSSVRAVFGGFKQVPTPLTERSSAASPRPCAPLIPFAHPARPKRARAPA